MTACFWWTELTSGLQWASKSLFGATSTRRVVFGTRWVWCMIFLMGHICWWSGPYVPGKWNNDLTIFRDSLQLILGPGDWRAVQDGQGISRLCPNPHQLSGCSWGRPKHCKNTGTGSEPAGDCQQAVQEQGDFVNPVPSQLVGTPNSFWCHCHSHPAFFCGQPFVSGSLLII